VDRARLQCIVDRHVCGELSAPLAVMHLLLETADVEVTARAVEAADGPRAAIEALVQLIAEHTRGCATIAEMLQAGLDSWAPAESAEAGIASTRALFDNSVARSEAASVALYSLGSEELLGRATAEVMEVLAAWGVLRTTRTGLEIGCGIGRLLGPLSERLASVVGVDISEGMVAAAVRRNAAHDNVFVRVTKGTDLADFPDASFDVVLAVDSFPYVVRSGRALASRLFGETRRVLRRGGDFVIFNYAYGRERFDMAAEVAGLAADAGFLVSSTDEAPFLLWNAIGYHLRRPS
jgi:predicted TPR repeat methyltransferase